MPEMQTGTCPICGGVMEGMHCKLMCRNCGYKEDCSDLFGPEAACPRETPAIDADALARQALNRARADEDAEA